jgi:hypothetical protein
MNHHPSSGTSNTGSWPPNHEKHESQASGQSGDPQPAGDAGRLNRIDYYYGHRQGNEAYINVDQGHFTISVAGETIFTGDPAEDPRLKRCVSEG